MAKDVDEAVVAIDGVVATAPTGTTAPTTVDSSLATPWADHGYVTEDGVTRSEEVTTEVLRAWQRNTKVRTLVTESAVQFELTLMQTSADNAELFHGVPVEADGSVVLDLNVERPRIAFVLDLIDDASGQRIREYAPNAQVVEVGEQVAVSGDGFGWPVTIQADYDETLGGHTKRWFSALETTP